MIYKGIIIILLLLSAASAVATEEATFNLEGDIDNNHTSALQNGLVINPIKPIQRM